MVVKQIAILFFTLAQICPVFHADAQAYSLLWGKDGKKWNKARIPDFTAAGYKGGGAPVPYYHLLIDVRQTGAIGDGKTDNTAAFRKAIQQCKKNQVVYIPEGTYLLSDSLIIGKSNICIRGEGEGKTRLYFTKGLEELYPHYNLLYPDQTDWSWSGGLILFKGNIAGSGIEGLSIIFPDSIWGGHNFHERAYNGIGFSDSVHNGWVRNVRMLNADLGIWIEQSAHHITVENWELDFGARRSAQKISGHHGINVYGGYNLIQNFKVNGKYQHDLSVESKFSIFNVFRNGSGKDLCIDHHNHAQSNNLFTNLDAGLGTRIYASGGKDTPRGICSRETFWDIRSEQPLVYCNQFDTKDGHSMNNVCVGIKTNLPSRFTDAYGNWFETIDPSQLVPADLYEAQLQVKKIRMQKKRIIVK